jgi:RNA polymerase sigma factor (TIGR02999 family)
MIFLLFCEVPDLEIVGRFCQLPSAKWRLTERSKVSKSEGLNAPKARGVQASVAATAALFFLHLLMRKAPRKTLTTPATHDVTELLQDWSEGDESALERLMPLVYDELHRLAHQHMRREKPGQILQTSALINEAYLRLVDRPRIHWENRAQFFGIAARVMRRILVDEARKRKSDKRGGDAIQVTLNDATNVVHEQAANVVALDEALKTLEAIDSRQGKIVELRFFGGLSVEETAQVLKVSPGTVMRDWTFARAWLKTEMGTASKISAKK